MGKLFSRIVTVVLFRAQRDFAEESSIKPLNVSQDYPGSYLASDAT